MLFHIFIKFLAALSLFALEFIVPHDHHRHHSFVCRDCSLEIVTSIGEVTALNLFIF
jgi:hypothetical protein